MEEAIHQLAYWGNLGIETVAILVVLFGSVQAVVAVVRVVASGDDLDGMKRRHVWLVYARWLVAGLTFQLAADILATSIAPSWDELVRLAIVAVIRTLLNFFLERDLSEVRRRQFEPVDSNSTSE